MSQALEPTPAPLDALFNALSFQQQQFALAYMANGGNATAAAQEAGYASHKMSGHQVLNRANVKAYITAARSEALKRYHLGPNEVLRELAAIAGFDLGEVMTFDPQGNPRIDLSRASSEHTRALASIETESRMVNGVARTGKLKIKAHDKIAALRLIMDHLGMIKQGTTVAVQVNLDFSERMAQRRARALEG